MKKVQHSEEIKKFQKLSKTKNFEKNQQKISILKRRILDLRSPL